MKRTKSRSKNIAIVAHKFVTQPDDELREYLISQKNENIIHIFHSFLETPHRKSWYQWYKNGELFQEKYSHDFLGYPEPIIYLKELFFTFYWLYSSKISWDAYIGMDGLCVLFGKVLQWIGKTKKTIFWVIDYVPMNRFSSSWKNWVYKKINTFSYISADAVWDLSPRMYEARQKFLGLEKTDYKSISVVAYGTWSERIKKVSFADSKKHTVVFMGHIKENQGAQFVIELLPKLSEKYPDITYRIIGDGPYRKLLEERAQVLGVIDRCEFFGRVEDPRVVEALIAECAVAVAPYISELDTWTYYADPGKVKTYLACGVPVILTDLPWNANEIQKNKCGIVVSADLSQIQTAIEQLFTERKNQSYRIAAAKYARSFDYDMIFSRLKI